MTTPYVSYGSIGSDCYLRPPTYTNCFPTTGSYCPPQSSYYPPSTYCPPTFGSYPPYTNPQTYDLSREKDYYKSELYRHEESTSGQNKGMVAGLFTGLAGGAAVGGVLSGFNPIGMIAGGIIGAIGGLFTGGALGNKLGDADAVTHDANDDQQQMLNGSPLEEQYHAPAYDPYYSAYPGSGYYG